MHASKLNVPSSNILRGCEYIYKREGGGEGGGREGGGGRGGRGEGGGGGGNMPTAFYLHKRGDEENFY